MKYIAHTYIGRRSNNEDCCAVLRLKIDSNLGRDPVDLLILSDGMGGLEHGEQVSRKAVETFGRAVFDRLFTSGILPVSDEHSRSFENSASSFIAEALRQVNTSVTAMIQSCGWDYAGATMVVCLIQKEKCWYSHLGDSRLYHWQSKSEELIRLTVDHTVPQVLFENQLISEDMVERHPLQNQLVYFIGAEELPDIKVSQVRLAEGDILLLCTDGISGLQSENTMTAAFAGDSLDLIAADLLTSAMEAASSDNMTLILYQHDGRRQLEEQAFAMEYREKSYREEIDPPAETTTILFDTEVMDQPDWDDQDLNMALDVSEEDSFPDTLVL